VAATLAVTGVFLIASPLVLQSNSKNGMSTPGTTKGDVVTEGIGGDFVAVSVHY
jgi:hypothetical protein